MQYANILLALGGDGGNTVQKRGVSAAEIAVLSAIHGESAVTDIEPCDAPINRSGSNRSELHRLRQLYGRAKDADDKSIVDTLFPGAAARVFETLAELDIDDSFYKPGSRMTAAPMADPLDHDRNGRKTGAVPPAPVEPEAGLDSMTKAELIAYAAKENIEIDASEKKADILAAIQGWMDAHKEPPETDSEADEEDNDGVGDMPDDKLFG